MKMMMRYLILSPLIFPIFGMQHNQTIQKLSFLQGCDFAANKLFQEKFFIYYSHKTNQEFQFVFYDINRHSSRNEKAFLEVSIKKSDACFLTYQVFLKDIEENPSLLQSEVFRQHIMSNEDDITNLSGIVFLFHKKLQQKQESTWCTIV
ncbi:MAG: hypothetical protein WA432_05135 [Candidatus Babeliaceae bacterium]